MLTNSSLDTHRGFRDCPENWNGSTGLRFSVGKNEYFRVGFGQERTFRALCWRNVQGTLVKGSVEMTDVERDGWESQGLRLAPAAEPGCYYSIEPIKFESAFYMSIGYRGLK